MSRHLLLLILLLNLSQSIVAIELPHNIDSILNVYYDNDQLEDAITYMDGILLEVEQVYGNQNDTFAFYLKHKADLNEELGNYKDALADFKTVLSIYEKSHASNSPQMIATMIDLATTHQQLGAYDLAEQLLIRTLEIQKNSPSFDPISCAYIHNQLSMVYNAMGNYHKGLKISKKGLNLQLKHEEKDFSELINSYAQISAAYRLMKQLDDAVSMEKQALYLQQKHFPSTDPELANRLNNLAALYESMNRQNEALSYYQKALEIVKENKGNEHPDIAIYLNNLAGCYRQLKQYKIAEQLLLQAISIFEKAFGSEHPNTIAFTNNIGGLYEKMQAFEKAKTYYSKAIKLGNKVLGEKHPYSILFKENLATVNRKSGNPQKALSLHLEGLKSRQEISNGMNSSLIDSYNNIAESYLLLGSDFHKQALDWIEKSIINNAMTPINIKELGENLVELSNRTFRSTSQFKRSLNILSQLQQAIYQETNNQQFLLDSYQSQKTLAYFIQQRQNKVYTKKDKLKILTFSVNSSSRAIELLEELIEISDPSMVSEAIIFAEYNKSAILSSALQGNQAFNFGEIPDSLKKQEKALKKELSLVKKKIIQTTTKKDKEGLKNAKEELINIRLAQDELRLLLENNYPKYNRLKNEQKILSTAIIQNELLDNQSALLEYCVYDSAIYAIAITKTAVYLQRLPIQKEALKSKIKSFRKSLSNYKFIVNNKKKAFALYTQNAYSLYQTLIHPIHQHLTNIEHLIIVPDNDLGHIPFEALLTSSNKQKGDNYKILNYLLNDYKISYSYSASLLLENKHYQRRANNGKILGFAATYNPLDSMLTERSPSNTKLRKMLGKLPAAIKEVQTLKDQFPTSDFFFGDMATEANFKQQAANYSILHLAMHGVVNHHYPLLSSLAFTEDYNKIENNFLEAHEISNLQLNNDLVVLSACETGYGEFEQGEGVLSLARSFMYAGTPSLIVSLWEVNDFSTAVIMKLFYQYLTDGMTKDAALRQAKLDFIQQVNGPISHPAFWSPFILLGDNAPIDLEQHNVPWQWPLLGFIGFLGFFLYFRNRSKKHEQI